MPLLGAYQASNALLAAGLVMATGEPADRVLSALPKLEGVKGRLEIMGLARGGLVVIDYAHKPDALAAALKALRPFAPGRLVCVFGCGGDRDKGKRPIMGRIAASLADTVIVTDDNPRSEDPKTHPGRDPRRRAWLRARSATAPRPSARARGCWAPAMCCWLRARAMKRARSSAPRSSRSRTTTPSAMC